MAQSPVAILVIIGIYVAFFGIISADASQDAPNLNDSSSADEIQNTNFGGLDILGDIINAIFSFVTFIFNALTFNVTGAPGYIRAPVAIAILASLIWSVVTLIRGN